MPLPRDPVAGPNRAWQGTIGPRDGNPALNAFAITFDGRITPSELTDTKIGSAE